MEIANVPTLHQRRVKYARIILTVLRTNNISCTIYSLTVARFLILYATGPHQCCLRLGHSDILILSYHGVYGIVHDVFSTQRSSLLSVTALYYSVHVYDEFKVPYCVLYCFSLNCTIQPDGC